MANSTLPEEDKADIPGLRHKESLSSNTAGGSSWSSSSSTGGFVKSDFLKDQEGAPDEPNDNGKPGDGGFYTPDNNSSSTGRKRTRFLTRRRAAIGGGITSVVVATAFGGLSVFQGPLEFVHIAQLLDRFHFSAQQDAQDSRLMKIARYVRDPQKPQDSRLGAVGNAVANKLEASLEKATGLKPKYNTASGRFEGYTIDKEHQDFKGRSDAEIQKELNSRLGISGDTVTRNGSDLTFNPDKAFSRLNTVGAYRAQTKFSRNLLGRAGYSKVSSYTGTRLLGTRAGWTFHPVKALDAAIQAKAIEAGKSAVDKLKQQYKKDEVKLVTEGVTAATVDAKNDTAKNSDGSPKDPTASSGADSVAQSSDSLGGDASTTASDLNNGTDSTSNLKDKITAKAGAGGAAGLAGLLCVVQGLDQHIKEARYTKAILPMMRMAGEAISLGSQVQSGKDITALQLGFAKDHLDAKDSKGNVTSTWDQASSIQAEFGQSQSSHDIPKSGQVFGSTPTGFINNIPGLSTVCSALGSPLGIVVSIVTGPINFLVSGEIIKQAVDLAGGWLTGAPVNPLAAGADYGNFINYGARLSANDQYAAAGGAQLSSSDELALKTTTNELDQSEFSSKNIAYRIFNIKDSRSLAGHLIDSQKGSNGLQDMASAIRSFANIFGELFKLPSALWSKRVHAASTTYDYHGLKKVGFTAQELADSKYQNPFQNGCLVVGGQGCNTGVTPILDSSNGSSYIDKAQHCFGIKITGDSASGWAIDSKTAAVDFQATDFPSNCQDSGNTDWVRIRFWLLDTQTIEGYDCYQSDSTTSDQSCSDLGFDSSTNASSDSTVSAVSGNAQDLAKQILSNNNVDLGCLSASVKQDVEAAANGSTGTAGAMTSSAILRLIATVGQSHKVCVTAIQSNGQGHTSGSLHYSGDAVDFGSLDGATITGRDAPAITILKTAFSVLPSGSGVGQSSCGPTPTLPSSWLNFDDTCNHLHLQVPRGTP